jgi:hypothetical protein
MRWFAVRHLIRNGVNYEERITLWNRDGDEEAIEAARGEAIQYALALDDAEVMDLFQSYRMFDPPSDGVEVFSLIRPSDLPTAEYIDRFFSTGDEFQSDL